jgi:hypothetical protein
MVAVVAALGLGSLVSCGGDEEAEPSLELLSRALLSIDDLDGEWTLFSGPDDDQKLDPSGILTEEQRELVPSFDLCDRASDEARDEAENLRPLAFRQLDLKVDDEIDPPFDRTGHMIFLQEFLYAGKPGEIKESFDLLRAGMIECFGEIPAGDEGPGFAEELAVPEVGDDRIGVMTTIEEAGGWAEWRIQEVLVRDGPSMMKLVVVDIRAGTDPYFTSEDFGDFVRSAAARL